MNNIFILLCSIELHLSDYNIYSGRKNNIYNAVTQPKTFVWKGSKPDNSVQQDLAMDTMT